MESHKPEDHETDNDHHVNYFSKYTLTEKWIKKLLSIARGKQEEENNPECESSSMNGFYFPTLIPNLERIAKEFPLWTNIMTPEKNKHATSSYVESYFNDLKNNTLREYRNPLIANAFLKIHLDDLKGSVILFNSKLKYYKMELTHSSPESKIIIKSPVRRKRMISALEYKKNIPVSPICVNVTPESQNVLCSSTLNHSNSFEINEEKLLSIENSPPLKKRLEDSDLLSVEDWKGLGSNFNETLDVKTTSTALYFKPFPQIRILNDITTSHNKPHLLPNGTQLKPTKIGNKTIFVYNTCPFDSIAHILYTTILDDSLYAVYVVQSSNEMLQFVNKFYSMGAHSKVLTERTKLLQKYYKIENMKSVGNPPTVILYQIDATDSICNTWQKLFKDIPSITQTYSCDDTRCSAENYKFEKPIVIVNHNILLERGFSALRESIDFRSDLKIKCRNSKCKSFGSIKMRASNQFFIELDIRNMKDSNSGMEGRLEDFPIMMDLDATYRLSGIIGYKSNHFISYSRRISGEWQKFDDLQKKPVMVNASTTITPHGAIYVTELRRSVQCAVTV